MAANISFVGGKAEAAFALTPAWWDASSKYVLDSVPNSEEMIKAAHLGWSVGKHECRDENGKGIGYYFTRREDTGLVLGAGMTEEYAVVQNAQGFECLDGLLQDGIMRYESAGALKGGRTVWALARMPEVDTIAEGDDVRRYILWLNSHDGEGGLFAIPTTVRVVCANTARLAIRGHRGIRHCGDMQEKIRQVSLMLSQYNERFTLFRDNSRKLASMKYGSDAAKQYIEKLFPSVKEDGKALEGRAKTIRENRVEEVRKALRSERCQLPSIKGTWWSLYNAISEAVDHGDLFRYQGNGVQRAENKMASVMEGRGADFKEQAFDLALHMAV